MPTSTRQYVAVLPTPGLGTALGYTVKSADGTTLVARTTSGIVETAPGSYLATIANWDTAWTGSIQWDHGTGDVFPEPFVGEDVIGDVLGEELAASALDEAAVSALLASGVTTLANGSITSAKFATVTPGLSGFLERLALLAGRFFPIAGGSVTSPKSGNGSVVVKGTGGATLATMTATETDTTQTLGAAS
jgi:hypothetical protein